MPLDVGVSNHSDKSREQWEREKEKTKASIMVD